MALNDELQKLGELFRSCNESDFDRLLDDVAARYTSPEDKARIKEWVEGLYDYTEDLAKELTVKAQMAEISDFINLSAIAKMYFNRSKEWLYQRINGCTVNGKTARFSPDELVVFNNALQDISAKIGSVRLY